MITNKIKGDNLEDAVAFIERCLAEINPKITSFSIHQKKRVLEGMHEIDVLVEFELDGRREILIISVSLTHPFR